MRCGDVAQDAYCSERSWLPSEECTVYDGAFKASWAACATSEANNGTRKNVRRAIVKDGNENDRRCLCALDEKRRHVEVHLHVIGPQWHALGRDGRYYFCGFTM